MQWGLWDLHALCIYYIVLYIMFYTILYYIIQYVYNISTGRIREMHQVSRFINTRQGHLAFLHVFSTDYLDLKG